MITCKSTYALSLDKRILRRVRDDEGDLCAADNIRNHRFGLKT